MQFEAKVENKTLSRNTERIIHVKMMQVYVKFELHESLWNKTWYWCYARNLMKFNLS